MTAEDEGKAQNLRETLRQIFGDALSEQRIEELVEKALAAARQHNDTGR
jgi:hypothetical protein